MMDTEQHVDEHLEELGRIRARPNEYSPFVLLSHASSHAVRRSLFVSFVLFIWESFKTIVFAALLSPNTLLTQPIEAVALTLIYPVILTVLGVSVLGLRALEILGVIKLLQHWGDKYAGGISLVNWGNLGVMFSDDSISIVRSAFPTLRGDVPTVIPAAIQPPPPTEATHDSLKIKRILDRNVATTMILLCGIIYERDDAKVEEAATLANQVMVARAKLELAKGAGLTVPDEQFKDLDERWRQARCVLQSSTSRIEAYANARGLEFIALSDLFSTSGAFCGVFYSRGDSSGTETDKPFMILVFKGTTLNSYSDFLIDASINRVTSHVFLGGGAAHEGFYTSVFPTTDASVNDIPEAYDRIRITIQRVAYGLSKGGRPVPLWLAGHSLGSAMANLTYMRLLHVPEDVGSNVELKSCFSFGAPRPGDAELASTFESYSIDPVDRPNNLWRLVNGWDAVARVPPGLGDDERIRNKLPRSSVLNFAHLGTQILMPGHDGAPPYIVGTSHFHAATEVKIAREKHVSYAEACKGGAPAAASAGPSTAVDALVNGLHEPAPPENVIEWAFLKAAKRLLGPDAWPTDVVYAIMPPPLHDHFPASYFKAIRRL